MAHNQNINILQMCQVGFSNYQQHNNLQRFLDGKPKVLGVTQVLIGLMKMCLWAMWTAVFSPVFKYDYRGPLVLTSVYPVWGPLCFFLSGVLSIVAGRKLSMKLIRGSLGMNIISAIVSGVGLVILTLDMNISLWSMSMEYSEVTYGQYVSKYEHGPFLQVFLMASVILSLLEVCVALTLSAFGCNVACFVTQVVVHLAPAHNKQSEVIPEHEYEEITFPHTYDP
ncbi:membrane-spanning 4-domains subfamily A member 4A-like isoform X1 [Dasypus novemcinctus]|uniref:membrane-spanning 4-domains subfamily A member 4A-like isoform X1 n=1 Tax=Dasypus novemcinctus TaxID=9361 RepID=UPI0026600652|nr:membrane-spanning 4-domains subfamily A member 4A-like isoform X1 [Dasypus novemcinctus]